MVAKKKVSGRRAEWAERADSSADGDELVYTPAGYHVGYLACQLSGGESTLVYIAQYERAATPLVVRPALHEVERYVERGEVRVVGIVDECAAVAALFHLKAQGNRLKECHTLRQEPWCQPEMEGGDGARYGVLNRRFADERQGVTPLLRAFIYIMYVRGGVGLADIAYVEGGGSVVHGPSELLAGEVTLAQYTEHHVVVNGIDQRAAVAEEAEFLPAFVFHREEILLVRHAKGGEYAYGGLYYVGQSRHLAYITDACLEECHIGILTHLPHGEGHTNL